MQRMQKFLIVTGLVLLGAGLAWPWLRRLPLGRLLVTSPETSTSSGKDSASVFPSLPVLSSRS